MKKRITSLYAIGLALALLPGCGNSQESPTPTSVNQAMLIEKSAQEQTEYLLPETFTGHWVSQEGRLTIDAQAQVVAEQGTALPTATVTPREFTQEDVDNLLKVFLKGEPLYAHCATKADWQKSIEYTKSDQWHTDPDKPELTPEEKEARRQEIIDDYTKRMETAPEEAPIVHGFSDSDDPKEVSGHAVVDGVEYDVSIRNDLGGFPTVAQIIRDDFKYMKKQDWGGISKEEAIAQGEALMEALGYNTTMVLGDAQQWHTGDWQLVYVPTVNGIPIPCIRTDRVETNDGVQYHSFSYMSYHSSEETNPDPISWAMESICIRVGGDGILSFSWECPSTEALIQEAQTALMPFEEIASIADTMLPVVIIGPSEVRSLVEIDQINGHETRMDVDITKVSLSLMRIRDKGSMQGTIVPVWDFWGTSDWYDVAPNKWGYNEKGTSYTTQPMLTLNAIDGNVVSREFGY